MKKTRHIFMLLLMVVGGILLSACNSTKQTEKKEFDTILFGRYDNAPVEWLVLDETDDSMLIISKNSIVQKEFHEYRQDMTWEVSSSRKWLNEDFFEGAFNYEEKSRIIKTHLTAKDNKKYNVPGGNDTDDFVFLLSDSEATKYFTDDESRRAFNPDGSPSFWWLRSPGNVRQDAAWIISIL